MAKEKDHTPLPTTERLRRQAEKRLGAKTAAKPPQVNLAEAQRLLHELEVHQIELEMQNAELRSAREEREVAHTKYTELFDFAPIGYFILDPRGRIQEANLAGAQLLGIERGLLDGKAFNRFIEEAEGGRFLPITSKRSCGARGFSAANSTSNDLTAPASTGWCRAPRWAPAKAWTAAS